ncbi:MAG: hypothetical protein OEY67_05430 [Gammaproteobacteria bacterium]|nr:hypothetical protein [Gammaproteobacteria bacterium]
MKLTVKGLIASLLLLVGLSAHAADDGLKPFVLAKTLKGADMAATITSTKEALTANGFEIAGEYSPYKNATLIVITNDEMKSNAAKTEFGGYGAAQRVSITQVKDEIQIAYTNPTYMAAVYRLDGDLAGITAKLESTLGKEATYGTGEVRTADKLRKYNYMFGMEKFDSTGKHKLAEYGSYEDAVKAVEAGLSGGKGGVSKVYRIDIPGKKETVFGVAIADDEGKENKGADKYIMERIDFADVKSTAHLPYEILVSDNTAYHLFARFRIAINFPDLKMMGDNSFMSIMSAPGAIKKSLRTAVKD